MIEKRAVEPQIKYEQPSCLHRYWAETSTRHNLKTCLGSSMAGDGLNVLQSASVRQPANR